MMDQKLTGEKQCKYNPRKDTWIGEIINYDEKDSLQFLVKCKIGNYYSSEYSSEKMYTVNYTVSEGL
jgi:hypothetical protein